MSHSLEILLSTMFRTDLAFLEPIFKNNKHFSNYNILIVNQTDQNRLLKSDYKSIKVINSFERGSPASRNLAISKATGDICLMADDDIVYTSNFNAIVLQAYERNQEADFISFKAVNEYGKFYANYPSEGLHDKNSLKQIYTWVITFKRKVFKRNGIFFNHYFGVGSVFKGVTEYVFLRNAYDEGLKMLHEDKTIVMHPEDSSGRRMGSDNAFFARAAAVQRFHGNLSYIWLLKYTFFMLIHKHIQLNECISKFKMGLNGISTYKTLVRSGEIDKIHDY